MRRFLWLFLAVGLLVAVPTAGAASADRGGRGADHVVFVQTNDPGGNEVVAYDRGNDGRLTLAGWYATGGNGAIAAGENVSDTLASQGSLVYQPQLGLLFAVNAGSNTVSMFAASGNRLRLLSVVPSGGEFPASIAVHRRLVYVLNSGGTGIVQGFRIQGHKLKPLKDSARSLNLANTNPPDFLLSPAQVGFTPAGTQLIVTTKGSGSLIDVFQVGRDGRLSATPVANPSATPLPFPFTFDPSGRLVVGEAGMSNVTTYMLNPDGTLTGAQSASDNQTALCWIIAVRGVYYVSNTASNTLSAYRIDTNGLPSLLTGDGIVATTAPGPIDLAASADGRFLYAQTGSGTIHEYRVNNDGTLTEIGTVALPAGTEGIVAL
jgi:6-phosphogluconolactonase (cycloisomerase 2 family)